MKINAPAPKDSAFHAGSASSSGQRFRKSHAVNRDKAMEPKTDSPQQHPQNDCADLLRPILGVGNRQ